MPLRKEFLVPSGPIFTNCKNLWNNAKFLLRIDRNRNSRLQVIYIIAILKNLIELLFSVKLAGPLEKQSLIIIENITY